MRTNWKIKDPVGPLFKLLASIVIISVVFLVAGFVWLQTSLAAPSNSGEKQSFIIKKGEDTTSFVKRLEEKKLVKSALAFRLFLKFSGYDKKIQAGSFTLSGNLAAEQMAKTLTNGRQDAWLTIVEGLRKEQVADLLEKEFGLNKEEFLSKSQEGYLFPDTYLIPIHVTVDRVLSIFESNFRSKFSTELVNQAISQELSEQQVVTLASIVERETRNDSERPVIAGILLKRLKEGIRIEADATVQYALGYSEEEKSWWRKTITQEDLQISSLYNTRRNAGLPPGPICSPGLSALKAVANPTTTDYYFYLHDADGNIHYGRTYAEHLQNVQNFLR